MAILHNTNLLQNNLPLTYRSFLQGSIYCKRHQLQDANDLITSPAEAPARCVHRQYVVKQLKRDAVTGCHIPNWKGQNWANGMNADADLCSLVETREVPAVETAPCGLAPLVTSLLE